MIYTGKLLRAEIYDDHIKPYTNVKAVYEAHKDKYPGKLIVTNGHWYTVNPSVKPTGNYKVNGTVRALVQHKARYPLRQLQSQWHCDFKGKLDGLGFWLGHRADYHDEVHYPRDGN